MVLAIVVLTVLVGYSREYRAESAAAVERPYREAVSTATYGSAPPGYGPKIGAAASEWGGFGFQYDKPPATPERCPECGLAAAAPELA